MAPERRTRLALAAMAACVALEAAAQTDTEASAPADVRTPDDAAVDELQAVQQAIRTEQTQLLDLISEPAVAGDADDPAALSTPALRAAAARLPALQRRLSELRRRPDDTGWQPR